MRQIVKHIIGIVFIMALYGCATQSVTTDTDKTTGVNQSVEQISFWDEQVRYPYLVRKAQAADNLGVLWELAYMDEYYGKNSKLQAPTVVLIHGRGANAGYFSKLMSALLKEHYRVVAVDIPGYGKTIPGNMNNPIARSLDQTREAVYHLMTDTLKIKKATILGHSMGGQWAIGFAARYPDRVEKLILESPYGLESYRSRILWQGHQQISLFDTQYQKDYRLWEQHWAPLNLIDLEKSKTPEQISKFYGVPLSSLLNGSTQPYIVNGDSDSRYLAEIRVKMKDANEREFDRYIKQYCWDAYAMGWEVTQDNQQHWTNQLKAIKVPVLMLFGEQDDFLPNTALSGNTRLLDDLVKPTTKKLSTKQSQIKLVIYKEGRHILHAQMPDQVAKDVVRFMRQGTTYTRPVALAR